MMPHHYRQFFETHSWASPVLLVLIYVLQIAVLYGTWIWAKSVYVDWNALINMLFERRRKRLQRLWEKENLR
jgi:hypothetical protein